jgi:hypothetical protein
MLRIGGNSIGTVIPVILYVVAGGANPIQFQDISNNVVENPKLQTLVMNDIQSVGSVGALGNSKRYYVGGITYAVDFTRFT